MAQKNKQLKNAKRKEQFAGQLNIDNNSTRATFLEWLNKCGRDLGVFEYSKSNWILSYCGSDGPTIGETAIGGIPYNYNCPEALDTWLAEEGLYEPFESELGDYNPPTIRYIDWFNSKLRKK